MQRPPQGNIKRRMIVLDFDDTLVDRDSLGDTNRKMFYSDSVNALLNITRNDPSVYFYILSNATEKAEIESTLGKVSPDFNSLNLQIFGKQELSQLPRGQYNNSKFKIITSEAKSNQVAASDIYWVDDALGDILEAKKLGFVPILVPWIDKAKGGKTLLNSSYLDVLQELVKMSNNAEFVKQTLLVNGDTPINENNYRTEQTANSLSRLYQNPTAKANLSAGMSGDDAKRLVAMNIKIIEMQMNDYVKGSHSEIKETVLHDIHEALKNSVRSIRERDREPLRRFIASDEFVSDKNPRVQQYLAQINELLKTPAAKIAPHGWHQKDEPITAFQVAATEKLNSTLTMEEQALLKKYIQENWRLFKGKNSEGKDYRVTSDYMSGFHFDVIGQDELKVTITHSMLKEGLGNFTIALKTAKEYIEKQRVVDATPKSPAPQTQWVQRPVTPPRVRLSLFNNTVADLSVSDEEKVLAAKCMVRNWRDYSDVGIKSDGTSRIGFSQDMNKNFILEVGSSFTNVPVRQHAITAAEIKNLAAEEAAYQNKDNKPKKIP